MSDPRTNPTQSPGDPVSNPAKDPVNDPNPNPQDPNKNPPIDPTPRPSRPIDTQSWKLNDYDTKFSRYNCY